MGLMANALAWFAAPEGRRTVATGLCIATAKNRSNALQEAWLRCKSAL
jgi:hypothetical protein